MSMLDRTLFGELRSISTCPTNVLSCRQQLSKEASTRALPPHSVPLTLGVRRNAARWTPKILAMDKRSAELKSIGVCSRNRYFAEGGSSSCRLASVGAARSVLQRFVSAGEVTKRSPREWDLFSEDTGWTFLLRVLNF